MATLREVAALAQVSVSTASYTLNGGEKVAPATRQAILAAADQLGYRPNIAARMLKSQKTGVIGVWVTTFHGDFFSHIVSGVETVVTQHGYALAVCTATHSYDEIWSTVFDGSILLDHDISNQSLFGDELRHHPMVFLDRQMGVKHCASVLLDNHGGMRQALDYGRQTGHTAFYIVKGPIGTHDADERLRATELFFAEHTHLSAIYLAGDFTRRSGEQAAHQLLKYPNLLAEHPCIVCLNDEMAIGIHHVFSANGITIGQDLSLIGFDHLPESRYLSPSLTTIAYSREAWGEAAAHVLLDLMEGRSVPDQFIATSLIEGQSVIPKKAYD